MYYTKHAVALGNCIYYHPYSVAVIYLVYLLAVTVNLFVNAVVAFYSALNARHGVKVLCKPFLYGRYQISYELFARVLSKRHLPLYLLIGKRVKVAECKVFKLVLYRAYTEPVRYRRIDIHSFMRDSPALSLRAETERSHIMQPVRQLDDYYSYIIAHCKKYLSDILRLLLLFGEYFHLAELCNAVYKHCHVRAELLVQLFKRAGRILNNIVQKCRTYSVGIHSKL